MRQNPGVQGLCAMRVGSKCEEGYCTQNLLQVMDHSDIALWVPMAAQNQRLQSEMLCLRVCEWKSELGESLKLISLDPRSGWEWVRRQRRCAMRAAVLFQTQWRCYTQILWRSVNFLGSESGKIHWISHSSHFTGQTFFLPDTPVYPAAAATCWFESTSSRPPCWPLKRQIHFTLFQFMSYLGTIHFCLFSDQLR